MSFVVIHQKANGADGLEDVEGFTLDASGVDKLRHPGATPILLSSGGVIWATEGKELGQFSAPPVPLGYDPKTGAPIYDQGKLAPIGYDPVTGAAIYPKAAAPVVPAPAPVV